MQPLRPSDPRRIGHYTLLGRIGSGGMGRVYLGRSEGRLAAVKVLHAHYGEDVEYLQRFRREVAAARRVEGVHTASLLDADPGADPPWLATEYVPGPSLSEAVRRQGGGIPEHIARGIGAGLAQALATIHTAGITHRDLKPGNVLLGPEGPKLIDFGLAREYGAVTLTASGMTVGTPGYMAPEQIAGEETGPAADVFALGTVLVYATTGRNPYGSGPRDALLIRALHGRLDLGGVPPGLREVIRACTLVDQNARPDAVQVLEMLGGARQAAALPRDPEYRVLCASPRLPRTDHRRRRASPTSRIRSVLLSHRWVVRLSGRARDAVHRLPDLPRPVALTLGGVLIVGLAGVGGAALRLTTLEQAEGAGVSPVATATAGGWSTTPAGCPGTPDGGRHSSALPRGDGWELRLATDGSSAAPLQVRVQVVQPDQRSLSTGSSLTPESAAVVTWPDDFGSLATTTPGTYLVSWHDAVDGQRLLACTTFTVD